MLASRRYALKIGFTVCAGQNDVRGNQILFSNLVNNLEMVLTEYYTPPDDPLYKFIAVLRVKVISYKTRR
jgi:hypothetical protein